ncbi:unnamed protein product [Notodromas monacha]|uniref:long-chain-fatty-acid--CoA ligase n=1 Tax=Notodromas monacha TaxID=399045 RepID=A0A7R9G882_9CRUS|nr:unnamed protein product [Notodromas monacha]CAG0912863.1 unnamed protein product [Notodromas monacha]
MDAKNSVFTSAAIAAVQISVFIYDVVTYPVYTLLVQPWNTINNARRKRAKVVETKSSHITYRSMTPMKQLQIQLRDEGIDTMVGVFSHAVRTHHALPALGTRQLLEEKGEEQADGQSGIWATCSRHPESDFAPLMLQLRRLDLFCLGKILQFVLGDYEWRTYAQIDQQSTNFGSGLISLGQMPKRNVVILAETRTEWLVAAYGCMKFNIPIVTLYATLGEDALAHGINETEVTHIITSYELLPKFKKILPITPKVKHVVVMEHQLHESKFDGFRPDVQFTAFKKVIEIGGGADEKPSPPKPSDTAIIMYTSGSTGTPKGVVLTHCNLVASMVSFSAQLDFLPDDVFMGFLPLAHVLELLAESVCLLVGVRIGYSSPLTITDTASKIMRGSKGDATVLQPTIMASVPLILDRIYKAITEKVSKGSPLQRAIFKFAFDYKRRWASYGYTTPMLDRIIFGKVKAIVGGRLRGIAVGGAPLSPETQEFIRTCLGCKVVQGYGLTETTAAATLQSWDDMNLGSVGSPLSCCDIKLVNWDEGNYKVTDSPNPRGEVHIGGDNVSMGYYKNPQKTAEDFYETLDEVNGGIRRWFKSGDIGEMLPEGVVKIIDRKKDLVKLQYGEYVSLGKVETELSTLPIVDTICIYGDPTKLFTVALVVPNQKQIEAMAAKIGVAGDYDALCNSERMSAEVLKELQAHGKKCRLEKFEIPQAVTLCSEMWTPDNSLVTAAFKLRRLNIEKRYKEDINRMYSCSG